MTKISVIMPVYNTPEEWLRESIESILNQTYKDFEFLIIDDGSTNNVPEILAEYAEKDSRIKIILGEHKGISNALNKGLELSNGNFIARMDGDDISLPNRFERQIEFLNNNSEISICGTGIKFFPNEKNSYYPDKIGIVELLNFCCIAHPTVMMRKKDLLKYNLKYDESFKSSEDYELWSRAIKYVRLSYLDPVLTYKTNVIGTLNVLEAARKCESVKVFVNITTDKCYENKEINIGYQEDDSMGGHDMYSSSKGCVEIMSSSYRRSFLQDKNSMSLATARAGNVIGGGDWGIDRLIPDLIVAINNGKNIELRSPSAIRPWQYILEPLSGYLLLGQRLYEEGKYYAQAFNFGPEEKNILNVFEITQKFIEIYGEGEFIINKKDNLHEANLLMLNINKSKRILNWLPTYDINKTIEETVKWYKHFYKKDVDIYEFTIKQIENFEKNIKW